MKPTIKEFTDDNALVSEIQDLSANGVPRGDLYVLAHDDERTDRLADRAIANTIGVEEQGLGTAIGNIFREQGDELRTKLQQFGYTEVESEQLEEKLDEGKVLLLIDTDQAYRNEPPTF